MVVVNKNYNQKNCLKDRDGELVNEDKRSSKLKSEVEKAMNGTKRKKNTENDDMPVNLFKELGAKDD